MSVHVRTLPYMSQRVEMRLPDDLLRRVDDARGDVSRTRWVVRALESALHDGLGREDRRDFANRAVASPPSAVPSRTPSVSQTWAR